MVNKDQQKIKAILQEVVDPEIPVLNILDLGIVRDILFTNDEIEIVITPTYTGCPAMDAIAMDIRLKMMEKGYQKVKITSVLSPPWTTDWMSEKGKKKLEAYGIAAPQPKTNEPVGCPICHSADVRLISQFGSTACKALYQCNICKEPFDYFKCH